MTSQTSFSLSKSYVFASDSPALVPKGGSAGRTGFVTVGRRRNSVGSIVQTERATPITIPTRHQNVRDRISASAPLRNRELRCCSTRPSGVIAARLGDVARKRNGTVWPPRIASPFDRSDRPKTTGLGTKQTERAAF